MRADVHLRQIVLRVPPHRGPGAADGLGRGGRPAADELPEHAVPAAGAGGAAGHQRE